MVKKALESLYSGRCDIYEYEKIKDKVTKITKNREKKVLSDIPCRLSIENISAAEGGNGNKISQIIKLFISNEIRVKPGSKIIVTQNGKKTEYKNSGESAVYSSHQEIILELFEEWA